MVSVDMALILVGGHGQMSALAPRLAHLLLFSDLLKIEKALPEIETAMSQIHILRPHCLKSRFILRHNLYFQQGGSISDRAVSISERSVSISDSLV